MRPNSQRGQVYPLFGIMLVSLIGISALSVDMGYYRYQQRAQQAATDSAAIAGGQANFYDSSNSSNANNAALADATQNGFTNGSGDVTITVDKSYTDAGNCSSGCVGVTIVKKYPVFFGSIFRGWGNSGGKVKIRTFAAAKMAAVAGSCLTSLGPTSVSSTTNGGITGPDCGVADADCSTVNGGGNMTIASFTVNAACSTNKWNGGTSQFVNSIPPVDPCSVMAQCTKLANATNTDLGTNAAMTTCNVPKTVPSSGSAAPGCYSSPNFKNVTLSQGLYVLIGTVTFSGTVTANNVTLYFAPSATYASDKSSDTFTFSAPTSGDYTSAPTYSTGEEGVLMYQKLAATKFSNKLNSNATWTGLIYMPNWDITFAGHDKTFTGNLAVDSFKFNGANVNLNPGAGTDQGNPSQVELAE